MPTKDEIKKFMEVFDKLNRFEAEHRARCGWGVWIESDTLPIPEVMTVTAWLKRTCNDEGVV